MSRKNDPKPLRVFNFSSRGLSSRSKSPYDDRLLDKLSKLERQFFELVKFSRYIKKLESQVWLDLTETTAIANKIGIRHPSYKKELSRMSTDFLITFKNNEKLAVTIKYVKELSPRVISKIDIEKDYWNSRSVDLQLFTDNDFSQNTYDNFLFLNDNFDKQTGKEYYDYYLKFKKIAKKNSFQGDLHSINNELCQILNWHKSRGYKCMKMCFINGLLDFNRNEKLTEKYLLKDLTYAD